MVADHRIVFDYIVVGGGTAGCVVASRLSQDLPSSTVALIEAGCDASDDPLVQSCAGGAALHFGERVYNYYTVPQKHVGDRKLYQTGGKILSGSSAINYCVWSRGHIQDYNKWSETVGGDQWSYDKLLPCFKKSEHWWVTDKPSGAHGYEGPIRTNPPDQYPMRQIMANSFDQANVPFNSDQNDGDPLGYGQVTESTVGGQREHASKAYDLSRVTLITNSPVKKIKFETHDHTPTAKGIELMDGSVFTARREVIISCGSLHTPGLLMRSGLGDTKTLESLNIKTLANMPEIGQNCHDHPASAMMFKLRHPEKGWAYGSEKFGVPKHFPREWMYFGRVPGGKLAQAIQKDQPNTPGTQHWHVSDPSIHFEILPVYASVGPAFLEGVEQPVDGSIIAFGVGACTPTSRGSVTLASSDPKSPPIIDPNYLATEHDRCVLREGLREIMRLAATPALKEEIAEIFQIPGTPISEESTDEELDAYVKRTCMPWFHPAGTAAMGKVVDSSCRVKGVQGLRVVDASVIPLPLSAHYQGPVYALAERAVEIMLDELKTS